MFGSMTTLLSLLASVLLVVSCPPAQTATQTNSIALPTPQSKTEAKPSATDVSIANSPIRLVDFNNIAYPRFPDYRGDEKRSITLRAGEGSPAFLNYGDITGDGVEDAMVVFGVQTRGSAILDYVYVFTMEKEQPKLVWDFETGDRADGGLRRIYAENGNLVIELFGKDRVVGGELYQGDEGLCCPSSFTRAYYKWTGDRFELTNKETLSNPQGDANVMMPRARGTKP